jgi:hypothetical protein
MENKDKITVYNALLKCHELNNDKQFEKVFSPSEIIEFGDIDGWDRHTVFDILSELEEDEVVASWGGSMFWYICDGGNYKG